MPLVKLRKRTLILLAVSVASIFIFLFWGANFNFLSYAMKTRIPKIAAILLTSFCLGAGTLIFQTITNNRILTPCIMGLTPLYIVVQTAIVFFLGSTSVMVTNRSYNFILATVVMGICSLLIYRVLFEKNQGNILFILLVGTIMGSFFGSFSGFLQRIIDPNEFLTLQRRLFASFANINTDVLLLALVLIVLLTLYCYKEIKVLDVIALGRDQAINLGVDYDKTVKKFMLVVTLLIGIATALVGPITFLGFIVTNLARELFQTYRHTYLIFGSILLGVATLLLGQSAIENIFNYNATLSALINLVGGLYFLYVLLKDNKA